MSGFVDAYPAQPNARQRGSLATAILTRVPMASLTMVLLLISCRYLVHPIEQASAVGISLTSPDGVIIARVGLGGFPLAFATFLLTCIVSQRRILDGLRTELMLLATVIAVRLVGMILAHSTGTAKLLVPEFGMATLCIIGIRLELARLQRGLKATDQ